jgi:hypothetical protein
LYEATGCRELLFAPNHYGPGLIGWAIHGDQVCKWTARWNSREENSYVFLTSFLCDSCISCCILGLLDCGPPEATDSAQVGLVPARDPSLDGVRWVV